MVDNVQLRKERRCCARRGLPAWAVYMFHDIAAGASTPCTRLRGARDERTAESLISNVKGTNPPVFRAGPL